MCERSVLVKCIADGENAAGVASIKASIKHRDAGENQYTCSLPWAASVTSKFVVNATNMRWAIEPRRDQIWAVLKRADHGHAANVQRGVSFFRNREEYRSQLHTY